ncbi:MAG: single-stranded DNA-binding protein [Ardenticatenaceae bacterium]|nr:single-stranded DNA-binding protein [Ardenticatenaceae bacterium]
MFQKMILVGNLGSDPDMRYMPDGRAVTNFSVAVNRKWTGRDGSPGEQTTWFRVAVWGNQAEACNQYLAKGRRVLVEGRLNPDPQTGGPRTFVRQDGSVGASFELTAQSVQFMGGNGDNAGGAPATQEEDDIPF